MKEGINDPKILSAYEKAAKEGIDPRCIPKKIDLFEQLEEGFRDWTISKGLIRN